MTPVRLMALDSEDLDVLAAHMQDAVLKAADLEYDVKTRQFALSANRFVWEEAEGRRQRNFERRRTVMHFDRVLSVRSRGIRLHDAAQVLSLLTVQFLSEEGMEPPSGVIELFFADDISVRLEVECIEVQLADLGPAWETRRRPKHPERP